jgi:amino acid transporter
MPIGNPSRLHIVFIAEFETDLAGMSGRRRYAMKARGSDPTRWSPLAIAAIVALVVAVLFLAPLPGMLIAGLWLICPLLMIGMHASSRHHGPEH